MPRVRSLTRTRRQRGFLLSAIAAIATAGILAITAFAVHDEVFQLDGDVLASTQTNYDSATQTVDWDSLFDANGDTKTPLPTDFNSVKFTRDFNLRTNGTFATNDGTTFATGSKDTLPITPGWQCNVDSNVNSKIDVMNAYTAAYEAPNGDDLLYFALERNANTGDANVGFWFLQDDVGCTSTSGAVPFTGDHSDGDLLVVSEFSGGGDVSTIQVYRWNGGANGSLGTEPVAAGADCRDADQPVDDSVCAVAATESITTPWLTSNKVQGVGHSLQASEFFEGGLNLTQSGLGGKCFNVFTAGTRSSTSLTATLFDFALAKVGQCTSTTVTTPVKGDGTALPIGGSDIPADPAAASLSMKDKATLTVTGVDSFSGTLSFSLCGPTATTSTALCETGGVSIGSVNVTTNGEYLSPAATVTSAGRYCWRAEFSGDESKGVPSSSDARANECFIVNPIGPTTVTDAGPVGSPDDPVDFGQAVTDRATLTGTAHKPGTGGPAGSNGSINPDTLGGDATGTLTFTLYKDGGGTDGVPCSADDIATGTGTNPQTVNVTGDGTYGPVSFTPGAPGTYHWRAVYSGDSPNTLAGTTDACNDPDEQVVVRQIDTDLKTKQSWYPNDTATVSADQGNLAAGGTVKFELFGNATCTGDALYTETENVSGGSPTEVESTSNTTFEITTGYADTANSVKQPYAWKVTYTPAASDTAHLGSSSTCNAEHFSITYTNDNGPN